jgi:DNA-binding transcriptional LysR family regulator
MLNETDLSRVDLNLLVLFEVVLRERHVGRAAAGLNLSPSAISHGLGRLRRLLQDPLFLRTPKGVVPTDRALALAEPVAEILARVRHVVASAEPFNPKRSARHFTIGAPDGASAVFLPALLDHLRRHAPHIDLRVRQLLPGQPNRATTQAWAPSLAELESRVTDIAVLPLDDVPARFAAETLYEEEFVIAARQRHPFAAEPSLRRYCQLRHLVVSHTGDAHGFVDNALAARGAARHVALTVPNFMMALGIVAEGDLIAAMPRSFVDMHGPRFNVVGVRAPLKLPRFRIRLIATKAAMMDAGLAWLFATLRRSKPSKALRA